MLLIATTISAVGQVKDISMSKETFEINPLSNGDKWIKTYDLNRYDGASSVQQTSDGGYIIVGVTVDSINRDDIWLIKTDAQGNKIWDKTFGGEKSDLAHKVRQTSDGGYIIIGHTYSYSVGLRDIWLIKTDKDGNKMWDKTFGDVNYDLGFDVKQTADSGYIIAGETYIPGSPSVPFEGYALLIKTDEFGNLEWESTYSDIDIDGAAHSVVQTLDGSYVVLGQIATADNENVDVWLFKTNSDGELLWEKTFIEDALGAGSSVQLTNDGGYILTGITSLNSNVILAPYQTGKIQPYGEDIVVNIFLIKTDSNGELLWEKTYGGDYFDVGYEVQQTNDGGYIIIGFTGNEDLVGGDGLLIKTDSDGEKEWSKTYGGIISTELIGSGQQTMDGGYILAGYKQSVFNSDIWLIKTDSNGNVARNRDRNIQILWLFELFPNLFPILRLLLQR